jgi:hypothetical protein
VVYCPILTATFVFREPLRFLGRLNGGVAVIFELSDTLSTLFDKLKELGVSADLKLLYVCQSFRGSLVADQPANRSDKIISSCRAKVYRLTVPIDERRHIVSFIDISPMAHDLPVLFGS